MVSFKPVLGSGSGFVGSARFWLPGSESKGSNINQKLQKELSYS